MDDLNFTNTLFKKYQMISDDLPVGICNSKKDGSINMNNTFCEMLGYTKNELLVAGWKDITYKADITKYHEIFDLYSTTNNDVKEIEKRFVKRDGKVIWLKLLPN